MLCAGSEIDYSYSYILATKKLIMCRVRVAVAKIHMLYVLHLRMLKIYQKSLALRCNNPPLVMFSCHSLGRQRGGAAVPTTRREDVTRTLLEKMKTLHYNKINKLL